MGEKVIFDMKPPIAVSTEDHYISLITYLVSELLKYTEVEIRNNYIIEIKETKDEIQLAKALEDTYKIRAEALTQKLNSMEKKADVSIQKLNSKEDIYD